MNTYERPKSIEIIYFTGTGGTRMAAHECMSSLIKNDVKVTIYEINKRNEYTYHPSDMYLFLYPVYAFNAPRPIYELVDDLPDGNGRLAAILSVSGGGEVTPNRGCRYHLIQRLNKKGYQVVYENMLVMPPNFLMPIPDDLSIRLLHVLPKRVNQMITELLSGVSRLTKPDLLNRILAKIGELEKLTLAKGIFEKNIKVSDKCNGCGLCAKSCPMSNIVMEHHQPKMCNNCTVCLRCIYSCPNQALSAGVGGFLLIKKGYDLSEIKDKCANKNLAPIKEMTRGLGYIGIRDYLRKQK